MADNNIFEELTLDNLEEVSGGRIKLTGYALLTAMILQEKQLGKSKEHCLEVLKHGWETDCEFKTRFTDGTDGDLSGAIAFIESTW